MKFFPYTVIRENWLTRKIDSRAAAIAALISLVLLFGALTYWSGSWGAEEWMAATRAEVFGKREWWRAWTTLLVHADAKHLASNSLLFFILGGFVYGYFGWLAFPVLAFVMGGVTNLLVLRGMPAEVKLIGVSGVVFWLGGFWLVLYFLIDRRRTIWQRALRATGVGLALFMPAEAFDANISYASHLYGFISGTLCGGVFYFIFRAKFNRAEVKETLFEVEEEEDDFEGLTPH